LGNPAHAYTFSSAPSQVGHDSSPGSGGTGCTVDRGLSQPFANLAPHALPSFSSPFQRALPAQRSASGCFAGGFGHVSDTAQLCAPERHPQHSLPSAFSASGNMRLGLPQLPIRFSDSQTLSGLSSEGRSSLPIPRAQHSTSLDLDKGVRVTWRFEPFLSSRLGCASNEGH
jgi:hypothetical protein